MTSSVTTGKQPIVTNGNWGTNGAIAFDGSDDYLLQPNFTNNSSGPLEISIFLRWTGATNATKYLLDTSNYYPITVSSTGAVVMSAITCPPMYTNVWTYLTFCFDGANSRMLTNNVVAATGTATARSVMGLFLAARSTLSSGWSGVHVSELFAYSATNSVLAQLTNFMYITNTYGPML